MLVNKHSDRDAIHVEPIKEVLDVSLSVGINGVCILQLHYTLSHRHNYITVAIAYLYQSICESGEK